MTSIRQLSSLQELDLVLDKIQIAKSGAEKELNARVTLVHMESELDSEKGKLVETQNSHQIFRQESETLRERVPMLEEKIYAGDINTSRELESIEQEAGHARKQLDDMEMRMLELSVSADSSRAKISELETELEIRKVAWESRHAELSNLVTRLSSEEAEVLAQRTELAATVDQIELQKYDLLRKKKGGTAVAKVERGLCQGCRMSLPTQHLQKVRTGRQTVLCNSCGRMLWIG